MSEFVKRVLERAKPTGIREYQFMSWPVPGKATSEAVGLLPLPGVDGKRVLERVMDVGRYVGNVDHVVESRVVQDAHHKPPEVVRFYQRIKIPIIGEIQHELVMRRMQQGGFDIAAWELLAKETEALSTKVGIRSGYSDGAWLVADGVVGYALSSAPRREDVGLIKWKALTSGAEVAASKMIRENIEAMVRWSKRP